MYIIYILCHIMSKYLILFFIDSSKDRNPLSCDLLVGDSSSCAGLPLNRLEIGWLQMLCGIKFSVVPDEHADPLQRRHAAP